MKKQIYSVFGPLISSAVLTLIFMPGCVKYHKIFKAEFPQGDQHPEEVEVAQHYLRSVSVYDEFVTSAHFDALWLSDELRNSYVKLHARRLGKDSNARDALLKRQLEENKHWISFYFLSEVRDRFHFSLTDKNTSWNLHLVLDGGKTIEPVSIKEIEVEPEYQKFFGHKFNVYKAAYLVKFPAQELSGKSYTDQTARLRLVASSAKKEAVLSWDVGSRPPKKVQKDEDFYWV